MAKKARRRKAKARRSRRAKSSVSVASVLKKLAKSLGLPTKAISISRPGGRRVQPRERLANVRAWWDSD